MQAALRWLAGSRDRAGSMAEMVGAVLVNAGRVLLGLRAGHKSLAGCWDLIGGHVEPGETLWSALHRELMEELGIEAIEGHHLRTLTFPGVGCLHLFLVRSWGGEPAVCNDEHTTVQWFTLEEAGQLSNLATHEYRSVFSSLGYA